MLPPVMQCYIQKTVQKINPFFMEKMSENVTELMGNHVMLLQINTLHCQQKDLKHKGGEGKSMMHML